MKGSLCSFPGPLAMQSNQSGPEVMGPGSRSSDALSPISLVLDGVSFRINVWEGFASLLVGFLSLSLSVPSSLPGPSLLSRSFCYYLVDFLSQGVFHCCVCKRQQRMLGILSNFCTHMKTKN